MPGVSVQGNLIPQGELKGLSLKASVSTPFVQGNLIPQGELKASVPPGWYLGQSVQGNLIPQGELKASEALGVAVAVARPRKSNSPRGIESLPAYHLSHVL